MVYATLRGTAESKDKGAALGILDRAITRSRALDGKNFVGFSRESWVIRPLQLLRKCYLSKAEIAISSFDAVKDSPIVASHLPSLLFKLPPTEFSRQFEFRQRVSG